MVDYVRNLDVENDLHILKENGIELGEKSVFTYKFQNKVLKAGVLGGYTPREIGNFMIKVYGSNERTIITPQDRVASSQGSQFLR